MAGFIHKYKLHLIGIALGAIAGYAYYHFIGCNDGSCAITSNPIRSSLYGSLMGGLFFSMFEKKQK